ncbi:hypothetical protein NPIL_362441 [Nephila pilipes]|uniref:Uncharacterized protein n=1 Tax=Nephila pilipes TaxID=299642 RepID=A0A8X6P316_NEPPI|nr:hypothetical protein NPIL_362441 [Nephila pilipes]
MIAIRKYLAHSPVANSSRIAEKCDVIKAVNPKTDAILVGIRSASFSIGSTSFRIFEDEEQYGHPAEPWWNASKMQMIHSYWLGHGQLQIHTWEEIDAPKTIFYPSLNT